MMTDYGLDATVAGSLFGLMIFLSIPVRLLSGHLADKVETRVLPIILGGLLFLEGIAIASFAIAPSLATMLTLIGALGVAAGAPTLLVLVLSSKLFGERGFATIQGSLMLLQVPGTMLAPIAAGYLFDFTGNYEIVTGVFALLLVFGGTVVALFIRTEAT
jgi:cyanate permease